MQGYLAKSTYTLFYHSIQAKEVVVLQEERKQVHEIKNEMEKLKHADTASKQSKEKVLTLEALVAQLRQELEHERSEKEELKMEKEEIRIQSGERIAELTMERQTLKEELDKANQIIKEQHETQDRKYKWLQSTFLILSRRVQFKVVSWHLDNTAGHE